MTSSNERNSSDIYLIDYFIYCPLLCGKEGQVRWFFKFILNAIEISLGRSKNTLLLSIHCQY